MRASASRLRHYRVPAAPTRAKPPLALPTTYEWGTTPLYDDMQRVVRAYRRRHGVKATDSWAAMLWCLIWGGLHYYALLRWVAGHGGVPNAVVLGLTVWFWCGPTMHDGTHYALSYKTTVNEWWGWLGGWMFCLPSTWIRQHVVGHHVHTNTPHKDPDLYHFTRLWHVMSDQLLHVSVLAQ